MGSMDAVLQLELVDPSGPGSLDGVRVRAARKSLTAVRRGEVPSVAVVLIAHPGPNFCVGGDVGGFAAAAGPGPFVAAAAAEFQALIRALVDCPVPVVAAVRGWAPDGGLTWTLPRAAGPQVRR
jgi:2-(1,2-epoxy-1,2-dihydrophenyl)acetyl-CoA isomerase